MKSGTGSDPFAEDGEDETVEEPDGTFAVDAPTESQEAVPRSDDGGDTDSDDVVDAIPDPSGDLPWRFRRDRVKDDRTGGVSQIVQLEGTDECYQAAEAELDTRYDEDLSTLDVREAIFLAGMMNLDNVESVLETWGYGYED